MTATTYNICKQHNFKQKMLNWANRFNIFCFLDNNQYPSGNESFDYIVAAGCKQSLLLEKGNAFESLKTFYDKQPCWLFGHLGYELKNEVESLSSDKKGLVDFGLAFFFEPEIILTAQLDVLTIHTQDGIDPNAIFSDINQSSIRSSSDPIGEIEINPAFSKHEYMERIKILQQHIKLGDCYEINFCQQFTAKAVRIDALDTFLRLNRLSPNPFSALYKLDDKYCLCASPERYLKKVGNTLCSQPIKGTSKRNTTDIEADAAIKKSLLSSSKERSENVMVVDMVRSDLSRICKEGSVVVEELFGIYSFPQVHQMISTIKGELSEHLHWTDAIKATFPMGSMTGAPKKRVMELIDTYEMQGRGLFSGSIGYVTPKADFDFNVVIRSVFYDEVKMNLYFAAGGGITYYSDPESEYNESLLKAEAIMTVLKSNEG